jgi:transcriptional regulator NrdR family protein
MKCPECGNKSRCFDTRPSDNNSTRRRWRCKCGTNFTTLEEVVAVGTYAYKLGAHSAADRLRREKYYAEFRDRALKAIESL